ncbi:MAG: nitric oxide synthase oxygenase, partial [Candidatus Eremiobacteraeota bacterium]|nr:nitric oxide synthase oxygenase [Candidatus Eremiobacteraeota bacterium]
MQEILQAAEEFLGYMVSEGALLVAQAGARLGEIEAEVEATGSYSLTTPELAFGARLAWR